MPSVSSRMGQAGARKQTRQCAQARGQLCPHQRTLQLRKRQVRKVPISEIPGATLRRRQKQRNYSGVQSDRTRNAYGCERTDVRQRRCSVPCRTRRCSSRAGFGREFDEPIALPNTGAIHYLDSAANAFSSCARPLATGPMQERIHGLS